MLIYDLINFCNNNYTTEQCGGCTSITACTHTCNGNCKECLDDIHFHRNERRCAYNCERLLDYYVCRYSYKYCSEIIYALQELDLSHFPYFNILSLGCGGAPDLMAFQYMNYPQRISYFGLDKNTYWERIHDFIINDYPEQKVQFVRDIDVLNYFDGINFLRCNVIVIQYLISFFFSQVGERGIREWFAKLANKVVTNKPENSPMLILINDVDSIHTGRDAFPILIEEIQRAGLSVTTQLRKRFKEDAYYANSQQYPTNRNIFNSSIGYDFAGYYCVARTCESAQLILEVD